MTKLDDTPTIAITRVGPGEPSGDATEHMVRMRDGLRLATDVYLPASGQPTEAVLVRLPYGKTGEYTYMPRIAPRFVEAGYAVVVQDVRGKHRSEGEAVPWVNEVADAHDTLDWIVQQEWSNGRVGMWGESYYGFTQWAAASNGHSALRAIVPRMTGTRLGGPIVDDGPEWFINREYRATFFVDQDTYLWKPTWQRPFAEEFERFFETIGRRSPAWDADFPHLDVTRRFPNGHPFDAHAVPTLLVLGWFDNCAHFGWRDYADLMSRPAWRSLLHLRVEAMDHESYHYGDVPIDESTDHMVSPAAMEASISRTVDPAVEFFDVYLREDPAAPLPAKVSWEHVNGDWQRSQTWPPPASDTTSLTLVAGDGVSDGRLSSTGGAEEESSVRWVHDPQDPVPSPYANTFAMLAELADEQHLSARPDVLTFTGGTLTAPVDLCGPVELHVTVSTTGPFIDVFVRLLDVSPDGTARFMARGQSRVRDAVEPTTATVSLAHVGYRLREGHRLRLLIAGSDSPEYVTAPGTAEDPWLTTRTETNEHTLHLGGQNGARLTLMVADPGSVGI
ncbi:CocE/NonD family hydrolase [Aeromicrobium endophyticum]|uniref:CocE/NonD family hydrolase n=1 Tax=Aeromicrobium endophyticum TaxID=2292704 RepID=A0A371PDW5_9ACTN|nr:CocE/NonD family hydrolase [Aeromicrobium endophyticum]REK73610.1 CocE/NonD family hydrolase [Aeromicrobium endophyticum]